MLIQCKKSSNFCTKKLVIKVGVKGIFSIILYLKVRMHLKLNLLNGS